ncbi:YncE family protein [Streptomyces sp. NPDC048664]|uniref:YncE family protein n=1 Tax=Streptomyces sp. NPDC048664 TaxID=3154505 RepID=UPI00341BD11B
MAASVAILPLTTAQPVAAAPYPAGNYIFSANSGSNSLTITDAATKTSTTVSVGTSPQAVAVNSSGTKAYVTNSTTVSAVDLTQNPPVVTSIAGFSSPVGLAFTPDGSGVYVANSGANNVVLINTSNDSTTTVSGAFNTPVGVAIAPDGSKVYVTNSGSTGTNANSVAVIPVTAGVPGTPTFPAALASTPSAYAAVMSPSGARLYVTSNTSPGAVTVVNTTTDTKVGSAITVGNNAQGAAINPAGTRLYATSNLPSGTVSVIDTSVASPVLLTTISTGIGANPVGVAVNQSGTRVYVGNSGSSTLSVIDPSNNTVTSTITTGGTAPLGVTVASVQVVASVSCPNSGSKVLGGGFDITGPAPTNLVSKAVTSSPNSWQVSFNNNSGQTNTVTPYVVCTA